ncbi:acylneuraminate cytidylyltransferase family protein [Gammaproteobacteria bacterium]|nr:acylneuraminate cytidylyltransferase family protein [Gammaproteobacteria bacterium]
MKKLLAVIPARGGSKGIPKKNIIPINGKPLISWTINAAKSSNCINRLVLSSDDEEIIKVSTSLGCDVPFRRPASLSHDLSSSEEVIFHAISELPNYEYAVLLQPTSPLRTAKDIDDAFDLMLKLGAPSCASVCLSAESPYLMHKVNDNGLLESYIEPPKGYLRRQDLPKSYILNGAIYIVRVDWFLEKKVLFNNETVAYLMPNDRSVDIDDKEDLQNFRSMI